MNASDSGAELVVFALESQIASGLPRATLIRIGQTARRFNLLMGLTGEFHLNGESFRLVVEGACTVVQPLAARILADPRHRSIRVTAFNRLAERQFERWSSFGFVADSDSFDHAAANLCLMPPSGRQPMLRSLARVGGR